MRALRCPLCYSTNILYYGQKLGSEYYTGQTNYHHYAYCNECQRTFTRTDELRDVMIALQTQHARSDNYTEEDRARWDRLQILVRMA
jgi:hypothetical protein